ncbi:mediator of RNA polymerase ii transcription subunit 31 [Anaeramoeba flamelloides]|uniref:Mediator of RNA polymerase II transcription subunit 31 n=1 Tax=Anaeramoeba flamelloides TaxID=1746091 RepID=A0AAV7Y823_9EUKA|nr:mediator of RNA polymerase ii transcription subunit [Anaeramoeba flamelloides]KAJ6255757.1 mediator of RNA polymerase ii transcription subunit 31 [Anaeramoeba flamelloides]
MTEMDENQTRFIAELEFIQALANPSYLNYLAQSKYFSKKEFVNFLEYLTYWKKPQYSKFILYPESLYILDLLLKKEFRDRLDGSETTDKIHQQQFYHWRFFKANEIQRTEEKKKKKKLKHSLKQQENSNSTTDNQEPIINKQK